jgi:DNA-binding MarR family transcriptional regulator
VLVKAKVAMATKTNHSGTKVASVPALELSIRLSRAYSAVMRRLDNALAGLHGLSFGDFLVLYHLERAAGGRLRRIDLAERLGMTASGVTRTLLPLEKLGLVERQPDQRDARVGYASITKSGRRVFADALASAEAVSQEVVQRMPERESMALHGLLATLVGVATTLAM